MSFVSIAGNSKYINVMSDGLAVFENERTEENWEKFVKISDDRFIAFAGTVLTCLLVVRAAEEKKNLPYCDWEDFIKELVHGLKYSDVNKCFICIGGKDRNLKFSTFSNKSDQKEEHFELTSKDISYAFLSNVKEQADLDRKFMSYAQRYRSIKSRDILLAQRDLNDFVSDLNPNEVNKKISYMTFK